MGTQLGDFIIRISSEPGCTLPARVLDERRWPRSGESLPIVEQFSPNPNIAVALCGDVKWVLNAEMGALGLMTEPASRAAASSSLDVAYLQPKIGDVVESELSNWVNAPNWHPHHLRGRHVFVRWNHRTRELCAFTDLFRTYPVYYWTSQTEVLCASDLRLILAALPTQKRPETSKIAIYHYLNFAYVPSPHCMIDGVSKLQPGCKLVARPGHAEWHRTSNLEYPADYTGDDFEEAARLKEEVVSVVGSYFPLKSSNWGTFLSGGTDSSSITGILAAKCVDSPLNSYSIGFAESGFDEMAYSRIAAARFRTLSHERFVGESDAVEFVSRMVKGFCEPFGNSSAIPTYYCAELAKHSGTDFLIAGDGGDEIFGGNERYAKDQIFGWYHRAPRPIRILGTSVARMLGSVDSHVANRIKNVIRRGELSNPDRFYSDDSFASDYFDELLTPEFRAAVGRDDSLQVQREVFERARSESELHRLMYLDLQLTIAEGDVVKVVQSAKLAGVDVAFPFLDRSLVEYSGRLPDHFKVRGLTKRYLFKRAMKDILPAEILTKKKQGFGLPISVWLKRGGRMHELVKDVVLSDQTIARGYFKREFIEQLLESHEKGSWDYSSELFRLLMLELWHREYLD